jgi:hypothetical protein
MIELSRKPILKVRLKGAQARDIRRRICQQSNRVWEGEKIITFYKFWADIRHFVYF